MDSNTTTLLTLCACAIMACEQTTLQACLALLVALVVWNTMQQPKDKDADNKNEGRPIPNKSTSFYSMNCLDASNHSSSFLFRLGSCRRNSLPQMISIGGGGSSSTTSSSSTSKASSPCSKKMTRSTSNQAPKPKKRSTTSNNNNNKMTTIPKGRKINTSLLSSAATSSTATRSIHKPSSSKKCPKGLLSRGNSRRALNAALHSQTRTAAVAGQ